MFTNLHLRLPFPADCLIPASTKSRVCYVQCAMALLSVEQEPTELTRARTRYCGQSKNQHVHQTSSVLIAVQALCLPLSARKVLSISLKRGSELQVQGESTCPLCCCGCMSPARGMAWSVVPGFIRVPLEVVLVKLKRGNLRVKGWVVLMPNSQDDLQCVASKNRSCE